MSQKTERRSAPRIKDNDIAIKLSGEGFDTITQSLDVSASGIYCKIDRHVPVMTRVQIVLTLPPVSSKSGSKILNIDGVVVREHPVMKAGNIDHYDVAIFFNTLMPREKEMLTRYINSKS